VIATGEQHSVRDFVVAAGAELGMRIEWRGEGLDEHGIDTKSGRTIVRVDPRYFRPTEVDTLLGDPTKAKTKLGWQPECTFQQLVAEMVAEDMAIARRDAVVAREGFKVCRYSEWWLARASLSPAIAAWWAVRWCAACSRMRRWNCCCARARSWT